MAEIYLISCVKSKQDYSCRSEDMYVSTLFKKMLRYAKKNNPNHIFILSAKYGLLELSDVIAPYEETLNKMKRQERDEWSKMVLGQLKKKGNLEKDSFVFLAGKKYRECLITAIKQFSVPMENLPIGKQLQWLKEQVNE